MQSVDNNLIQRMNFFKLSMFVGKVITKKFAIKIIFLILFIKIHLTIFKLHNSIKLIINQFLRIKSLISIIYLTHLFTHALQLE